MGTEARLARRSHKPRNARIAGRNRTEQGTQKGLPLRAPPLPPPPSIMKGRQLSLT